MVINQLKQLGFQVEQSYSTPNGEVKELRHKTTHGFVVYVDINENIYANVVIEKDHSVLIGKLKLADILNTLRELGF